MTPVRNVAHQHGQIVFFGEEGNGLLTDQVRVLSLNWFKDSFNRLMGSISDIHSAGDSELLSQTESF